MTPGAGRDPARADRERPGPSPEDGRAETYLRLCAEAELRRALALPRYEPPRPRACLPRCAWPPAWPARRRRLPSAPRGRLCRSRSGRPRRCGRSPTRPPGPCSPSRARRRAGCNRSPRTRCAPSGRSPTGPPPPCCRWRATRHASCNRWPGRPPTGCRCCGTPPRRRSGNGAGGWRARSPASDAAGPGPSPRSTSGRLRRACTGSGPWPAHSAWPGPSIAAPLTRS